MPQELTDEIIKDIKSRFEEVYLSSLDGQECIYRTLTVKEYIESLRIAREVSSVDGEEYILQSSILWPTDLDLDDCTIGGITNLADAVLDNSGFSDIEICSQKIQEGSVEVEDFTYMMMSFVIASNQGYSVEQLENMNLSKLAKHTALAQQIFAIQSAVALGNGETIKFDVTSDMDEASGKPIPQKQDLTPEEFEQIRQGKYADPEKSSTIGTAPVNDPIAQKLMQSLGG